MIPTPFIVHAIFLYLLRNDEIRRAEIVYETFLVASRLQEQAFDIDQNQNPVLSNKFELEKLAFIVPRTSQFPKTKPSGMVQL